jgi:hypothetical protein
MIESKPYAFGDVVQGHRWTVVGWERIPSDEDDIVDLTDSAVASVPRSPAPASVLYAVRDVAGGGTAGAGGGAGLRP